MQRRSQASIQLEIDRIAQIVEHQLKRAAAGGGVTLGQAPVPVLPLVTDLRAALIKVHARKDLRIEIDVPPELGFLGDSGDILELLGNVIDNACKWCRSRVLVSAQLDPDRALPQRLSIVVDDDGPGIAAGAARAGHRARRSRRRACARSWTGAGDGARDRGAVRRPLLHRYLGSAGRRTRRAATTRTLIQGAMSNSMPCASGSAELQLTVLVCRRM